MSGALALLRAWLEAGASLLGRLPDLAALLAPGSWPAAVLAAAAGLALLLFGARLARLPAALGAACLGWQIGGALGPLAEGWLAPGLPRWIAAALLGATSALAPDAYPIALGLVPGALLGAKVPLAGRAWLGSAVGGAALAVLGVLLRRVVIAGTAATAGAVLVVTALLSLSGRSPALRVLAQRPPLVAGLLGLLVVAGTAFQLGQRSGAAGPRARKPGKPGSAAGGAADA